MSLPPTDENENEHPMIARYGKDVFAHLEVIRLIAVSKMNIYQFGDHKQILLKSLFEQMYASLCKHVAKYDKDGKSYDKKSIEEVIHKALEADNINFLPNFDFEEDLIQIPRTIYRNRTEIELGNEERKTISEKTVAVNINNSGETENDDYQNPEKSCAKTFDITNKFSEETTFVVAENEDTALKTLQKENSPKELLIDENDDDLLSNLSLLEISNNSPRIMDRNSRRKGKCFNSTELASTSINVTGLDKEAELKMQRDSMNSIIGPQTAATKKLKKQQEAVLRQLKSSSIASDQTSSTVNPTSNRVLRPRKNQISYKDGTRSKTTRK